MAEEASAVPAENESTISPQPQTKSWVLKYVIFGLGGLLLLGGTTYAGYWWGVRSAKLPAEQDLAPRDKTQISKLQVKTQNLTPTKTPTVASTSTPTPTPDPTADWKTLEYPNLKFKIGLPPRWSARGGIKEQPYWYDADKKIKHIVALGEIGFWEELNEKSTIKITTFDLTDPYHRKYFQENLDTAQSEESIKIGEKEFKKYSNVEVEIGPGAKKWFTFWTLENKQIGAKFMIGDRFAGSDLEEMLLRQILSTFRFLD